MVFLCHFLSGLALQLHNFSEKFEFMNCYFIFRRFFAVLMIHLIANALWHCRCAYFMRFLWLIWTGLATSLNKRFNLFIDSSISTASIWFSVAIELMQGTRPVFDPDSGICMIGEFSEMQSYCSGCIPRFGARNKALWLNSLSSATILPTTTTTSS